MILYAITPDGSRVSFPATYTTSKESVFLRGMTSNTTSLNVTYGGDIHLCERRCAPKQRW